MALTSSNPNPLPYRSSPALFITMDNQEKALWLLDIDGVVNAYAYPSRTDDAWPEVTMKQLKVGFPTYTLFVATGFVDFIKRMIATDLVEIKWATTWQEDANEIFAPAFGFPLLEIGAPNGKLSDYSYKQRAAAQAITSGRRLIWTDDEEIGSGDRHYARASGIQHLYIAPEGTLGLTPDHCEQIEAFIMASSSA